MTVHFSRRSTPAARPGRGIVAGSAPRHRPRAAFAAAGAALALMCTGCGDLSQPLATATPTHSARPAAPHFSSSDTGLFTAGKAGAVTVTAAGTTAVTESGHLPAGLSYYPTHDGGVVSGTPGATSGGVYRLTLRATGPGGSASQSLTITVDQAPKFLSGGTVYTTALKYDNTPITTSGYPSAVITEEGALPSGMVFTANSDGTATITGNPTLTGSAGDGTITLTAANAAGSVTEELHMSVVNPQSVIHSCSFWCNLVKYGKDVLDFVGPGEE